MTTSANTVVNSSCRRDHVTATRVPIRPPQAPPATNSAASGQFTRPDEA
jgi:hypothetical protein